MEFLGEILQCPLPDRLPNGSHVVLVEPQVVDGIQLRAENLITFIQMM